MLAIDVSRILNRENLLKRLDDLFVCRNILEYMRANKDSWFTDGMVLHYLSQMGVETFFVESGSPWENGYDEWSKGKLCDELLNLEVIDRLLKATLLVEKWHVENNLVRRHNSMEYRPLALGTLLEMPYRLLKQSIFFLICYFYRPCHTSCGHKLSSD